MTENKFLDKEGLAHYHSLLLGTFPSNAATNDDIAAIFLNDPEEEISLDNLAAQLRAVPKLMMSEAGSESSPILIQAQHYYIWEQPLSELHIQLEEQNADRVALYFLRFTPSSNFVLTIDQEIQWVNDSAPTWEEGVVYELSILDNYITYNIY